MKAEAQTDIIRAGVLTKVGGKVLCLSCRDKRKLKAEDFIRVGFRHDYERGEEISVCVDCGCLVRLS